MLEVVKPVPAARAIFEEVITRLLDGDFKDGTNEAGRTYLQELARQLFLSPDLAAELRDTARLPAIRAGRGA
jgi:hypothetical protein